MMIEGQHINKAAPIQNNLARTIIGRNEEISAIKKQLIKMLQNEFTATFIGGGLGVGKTALVKATLEEMNDTGVFCVYGKFDQHKNKEPYLAIIQIIEDITDHLLTLPEDRLKKIRKKLLNRLGQDAALLVKAAPWIQQVLKGQIGFKEDSYQKVKQRWEKAFKIFIQAAAAEIFPLIIFIDDLQWADRPSLDILKSMMSSFHELALNMIFTSRINQQDYNENMQELKSELCCESFIEINLENISLQDIETLLSVVFEGKLDEISDMSRMLYGKTLGNPLYIKQTIQLFLDSGEIYFDKQRDKWVLGITGNGDFELPSDVEGVVNRKIGKLGAPEEELLQFAACMGNLFRLDFLQEAVGYDTCIMQKTLHALCETGLIVENKRSSGERFEFLHDKINSIVYDQISPDKREYLHFCLAMLFFNSSHQGFIKDHLLYVIPHFLKCKNIVRKKGLRSMLLEPLYLAGLQAKQLAAAEHALELFAFSEELLAPSCWETDYNLTLAIKLELAQYEFICGLCDASMLHFKELLIQVKNKTDLAAIKKHYMVLHYYVGEYDTVINLGLQALAHLGFSIDLKDLKRQIAKELLYSRFLFRKSRFEQIKNADTVKDKNVIETLEILNTMAASVNLMNKDLFLLIVLKVSNLSAKYGNTPYSPVSYAAYSLILGSTLGDCETAKKVENLALSLVEQSDDETIKCQTYFILGTFVHHWYYPVEQSLKYLKDAFYLGVQSGEFLYSGFAVTSMLEQTYFSGRPLNELHEIITLHEQYGQKIKHDIVLRLVKFFKTQLEMLTNHHADNCKPDTNEGRTYDLLKMQRLYLEGNIAEAYELSKKAIIQLDDVKGYYVQVEFVFYYLLLSNQIAKKQKNFSAGRRYKKNKKKLKVWAQINPENHKARYLLIEALESGRRGKLYTAGNLYDQAIVYAQQSQNLFIEALCNYLAAEFYGLDRRLAQFYAGEACRLISLWGSEKTAMHIAAQFSITYPFCLDFKENTEKIEYTYKKTETADKINLSLGDRLRPLQKKLETLELEAAYPYFLEVIGVHTAADSGAIFLERDDKIDLKYQWVEAEGSQEYESDMNTEKVQDLPRSVIRYVSRTYEEVILPEKPREGHFSGDSYFRNKKSISLLCLPLKYKGIFVGLIYLESWSINGFSGQDIDFIKGLSFYLVAKEVLEKENLQSGKSYIPQLVEQLTSRELEVLNFMAEGMSNKEIAEELGINPSTVKTHTLRIYRKFNVSSRLKAVTKAGQLKLI